MLEEIGEVNELSCYLNEPLIDVRKGNPYKWWYNNSQAWPDPRNKRRVRTAPYTKVVLNCTILCSAGSDANF